MLLNLLTSVLLAARPDRPGPRAAGELQLPNGRLLTPTGTQTAVLPYPFAIQVTPDGKRVVAASTGVGKQALQVLDARTGRLLSSTPVEEAWLGLAVAPDGRHVYTAGADGGNVLVHRFEGDRLDFEKVLPLATGGLTPARAIPSGLAASRDGRSLWVARMLNDDVVRIDLDTGAIESTAKVGRYPYRPVLSRDGKMLAVSNWAAASVTLLDAANATMIATVATEDHPSDLVFSADGKTLFVAQANRNWVGVVDVDRKKLVRQISTALAPEGPGGASADRMPDGSTPNALALTPDGGTLFVANADDDAVAVVDVATARVRGFAPTGWYPDALALTPDGRVLFVANGKGSGSASNAKTGPVPGRLPADPAGHIKFLPGSVSRIPVPDRKELARLTERAYANRKPVARGVAAAPSKVVPATPSGGSPIRHVVYVIRENRTYDQVLGDLPRGNGDPSLVIFGNNVTPNAHALAQEFVLLDNFYADAEVSADGHNWSTAAYATDFTEKTWPVYYGGRGLDYGYEGSDPAAAPTAGYLWDAARRAKLSVRNFGEFTGVSPEAPAGSFDGLFRGLPPGLADVTCPFFPGFDLDILDVSRVDLWLKEFRGFVEAGEMPRLMIVRLGNDHTEGTKTGARTPRAMVADNDLALGRLAEAISHSPFWKDTAIFVVEDDAQNGCDHVDAHRTVAFVISPYTRRGGAVDSTLYSTTSMLRTMELVLGLPPLSQHDASATPMTAAFRDDPDPTPFTHRESMVPLFETNGPEAPMQAESSRWDFSRADAAPDHELNEAIWKSVCGKDAAMPAPVNAAFVKERVRAGEDDD